MKLSLIITTYNKPIFLEMVFLSLRQQKLNGINYNEIEVLIADDGSTVETKMVVEKYQQLLPFKLVHVWHNDDGFRASRIRNLAVSKSHGEYLLFIDGDCLLPPDFISNHMILAEMGCCVAGNRVLLSEKYTKKINDNSDISITNLGFFAYLCHRLRGETNKFLPRLRLPYKAKWRSGRQKNWKLPKSCNLGIWRCDYMNVNGFDELFHGWGREDSDLVVRLIHYGIKIKDGRFFVPIFHLWHKESDRSMDQINYKRLIERVYDAKFIKAEVGINNYI